MSGYAAYDGLVQTALAVFIILSAIVSLIGTSARRQTIEEGFARAKDLCELTGITNPRELQDVFGPPDMNRIWHGLTIADIEKARTPIGHLMSDDRIDYLCILTVGLSLLVSHPLVDIALIVAAVVQAAAWVVSSRLPG